MPINKFVTIYVQLTCCSVCLFYRYEYKISKISGKQFFTPLAGLAKVILSRHITLTSSQTKKLFLLSRLIIIDFTLVQSFPTNTFSDEFDVAILELFSLTISHKILLIFSQDSHF